MSEKCVECDTFSNGCAREVLHKCDDGRWRHPYCDNRRRSLRQVEREYGAASAGALRRIMDPRAAGSIGTDRRKGYRRRNLKEALSSGRKPDITHVRSSLMVYAARACEYGSAKYDRANYMRAVDGPAADFKRCRGYAASLLRHVVGMLDTMERHQSVDPNLEDVEGMRRAVYSPDPDETPGAPVGASMLPHVAHAAAALMMLIEQATASELLPADPGQPWRNRKL